MSDLQNTLFSVTGAYAGPHLMVVGPQQLLELAARNLAALPSLVYLRGSLSLSIGGVVDTIEDSVDDVLDLTTLAMTKDTAAIAKAHWTILARATSLGMISGRGLPRDMSGTAAQAA